MRPTDNIKHLIKTLNIKAGAELGERTIRDAIEAQPKEETFNPAQLTAGIWRIIMRSPITKLAVAAVIVIAALIAISQYGRPIDGAGTAWADVMKQVHKARTVVYKQTLDTGDNVSVTEQMINDAGIKRWTLADCNGNPGHVSILDYSSGTHLQFNPEQKKAFDRLSSDLYSYLNTRYLYCKSELSHLDYVPTQLVPGIFLFQYPLDH